MNPELASGIARIDSNEGGGAYKITEIYWTPAEDIFDDPNYEAVAQGCGVYNADARDWLDRPYGHPGDSQDWITAYGIVRFWHEERDSGVPELLIDIGPAMYQPFMVRLLKDGGSAGAGGAGGSHCGWTYTLQAMDHATTLHKNRDGDLATGMSPLESGKQRMSHVQHTEATYGLAAWYPGGTLVLLWAIDECPVTRDFSFEDTGSTVRHVTVF